MLILMIMTTTTLTRKTKAMMTRESQLWVEIETFGFHEVIKDIKAIANDNKDDNNKESNNDNLGVVLGNLTSLRIHLAMFGPHPTPGRFISQ